MNKRGYEFSFSWIFAIIIGAVVIFIAIYITTQVIDTQRSGQQAVRGKELGTILIPLETNLEQAKSATISVPNPTKILNDCSTDTTFGTQKIGTYIKSNIGGEWRKTNDTVKSEFHNKYLFSSAEVYGEKNFYVLSKPFKFPYKISDLMIVWPDTQKYCFVNAWDDVKHELKDDLKLQNIEFQNDKGSCSQESTITVCFTSDPSCDIRVIIAGSGKQVIHGSETLIYEDSFDDNDKYALLYAAIFSDPQIYRCQVTRIMQRASQLATLYSKKSDFITQKGCRSSPLLPAALNAYKTKISSSINNFNLKSIAEEAKSLEEKNAALNCRLF